MAALRTLEEDLRALNLWNPQLGSSRNKSGSEVSLSCESSDYRDEVASLLKRAGLPVIAEGDTSVRWARAVSEDEELLGADVLSEAGFRFVGGVLKKAKSQTAIAKAAGGFSALRKKRKMLRISRRRNKSKIRRAAQKTNRKSSTKRRRKKQMTIRKRRGLTTSMSYGKSPSLVEELQGLTMRIDGTEHKKYLAKSFVNVIETADELGSALKKASNRYCSDQVLSAIRESLEDLQEMVDVSESLIEHLKGGGSVLFEEGSEEVDLEAELEDMAVDLADSMELFQDLGVISVTEEMGGDECASDDEDSEDSEDEEDEEDEDSDSEEDEESDDDEMEESRSAISRLSKRPVVTRR